MSEKMWPKEAENAGLFQLYEFSSEDELIQTQWGELPIRAWLEREKGRIEQNPLRRAAVVRLNHNSNMLALFVNPPIVWEREARELGYSPLTDWSTPDDKFTMATPRPIIINKYERAAANNKRGEIVREDCGDHFAVFYRA